MAQPTYTIIINYPTGTVTDTLLKTDWDAYQVPAAPDDYLSATAQAKCQLFTDTSYSVNATSVYNGNTFSIYRKYSGWTVNGTKLTPGSIVGLSSVSSGSSSVTLVPVIASRYAVGRFDVGPYGPGDFTITGNANYPTGTGTNTSLTSHRSQRYYAKYWTSFAGVPLNSPYITPGTTQTIQLAGVSYTEGADIQIRGVFSHRGEWESNSLTKTLADLPKPATPPNSSSSYNVTLKTSSGITHSDQTLTVQQTTSYSFSHWSTDAAGNNVAAETSKPLAATTYYANWKATTTTQTKLPQWTTTQTMKYGSSAYDSFTLDCYSLPSDTTPLYTKTVEKYEFKPAQHTGWKSGSTTYTIGSTVTLASGSTYTAIWQPNASGTSTYEIYDNVATLPTPTRTSYSFLGWSTTDGGNAVFCGNVISGNGLLSSHIYPEFWIYSNSVGTQDGTYRPDVFIGYDYLVNNQGYTVPVLYKTDSYSIDDPAYSDPDYAEPFYYVGTEYYDGTRYDKWKKVDAQESFESSRSVYVYTQPIVTAGSDFLIKDEHMIISDVIMYAVWKVNGTVEIYNSVTKKFEKYQAVIYNSTTGAWDRYIPKIGNGTNWSDAYM